MRPGEDIGGWNLVRRLGGGGNGEVWEVTRDGAVGALKLLHVRHRGARERSQRFQREIEFLLAGPNREGVLPLIADDVAGDPAWYVMPIATPLVSALGQDPSPKSVIEAIQVVAETLASLAAEGIGHRDIKPDNLFDLAGRPVIGDFGLVTYPEAESITRAGRRVGPIDFMAPEMRDAADEAHHEPADVYSLAKTLWVLLTGTRLPLPGPHRIDDPAYAVTERLLFAMAAEVDRLMEAATTTDPESRPSMREFADELGACLATPPEARVAADRDAVIARINSLAEFGARRSDRLNQTLTLLQDAGEEIRSALTDLFDRIQPTVPRLSTNGIHDQGPASLVLPSARAMTGERHVGASFVAAGRDENHSVSMSIGLSVRVEADGETASLAGAVRVDSSRPAPGVTREVYARLESVRAGSARQHQIVSELAADIESAMDDALGLFARLLADPGSPA